MTNGNRDVSSRLNREIIACQACSRLVAHCRSVGQEKRKAYRDQSYWAKPVPNLGRFPAALLIVGLAPGAHGANRTGRMFTGDESGRWLFRALHRAGFANQPTWQSADDGLQLMDCAITAVNHCAPPDNKPTLDEMDVCEPFLQKSLQLCHPMAIVCLGQIAWNRTWRLTQAEYVGSEPGAKFTRTKFVHAATQQINDRVLMVASYHPSQQNTFTKRLTEPMLDDVFMKARNWIERVRGMSVQ